MKRALLTGVGREGQVGEAVAARLAADGFELILVGRTAENVEARAKAIRSAGGIASGHACDLADPDAVDDLIRRIGAAARDFRLHALVHMAGGFAVTGPVAETAVPDWDRQLSINLRTAFLVSRAAIPLLRGGASIVFFSSESALPGAKLARISAYAVAKSGLVTLALAISQEERTAGIRANVVAPAAIRTATNAASMGSDAKFVEREDVGATVAYLCSDAALAITGQVLRLSPR